MTVKVLIADDQALVRSGFRMILEARDDLEVVGEAGDGAEAVRLATQTRADVVLTDVRMPGLDGISAPARLSTAPHPPNVIILTTYDLEEPLYSALRAGASGFLPKDARPADLVEAVRVVADGEALLAPTATRRLLERFLATDVTPPASTDGLDHLTEREREVLALLARGASNAEIAARLTVTEATVKAHVSPSCANSGSATGSKPSFSPTTSDWCAPGSHPEVAGTRSLSLPRCRIPLAP
ncbi:response regulator transcription factor [Streptomyces griseofuscus]|uniref:Response regulator transcription factor n=1 Tax=Streptomyces griseofuscus TaxID=146922 RepID=A0A7H1QBC2_9ACTN|nr:response regulator transcription factor [Streptomyces griseofuscus]